jgi:adenylate cyclase
MVENQDRAGEARRIVLVGMAIVAALFLFNSRYPAALQMAELKTFDLRMYARKARQTSGQVAIVAIDDKSIVELGRWPWPRTVLAQLTDALRSYKTAVVGFDMVFSERDNGDRQLAGPAAGLEKPPTSTLTSPLTSTKISPDEAFAQAIRAQGHTFVAYPFQVTSDASGQISPGFVTEVNNPPPLTYDSVQLAGAALPPPLIEAIAYLPNLPVINRAARGTAFFNAPSDADGEFRSELMVVRFGRLYYEPFVLALAGAYLHGAPAVLTLGKFGAESVEMGRSKVPVDDQGRMLVNFRGPAHTFPYYSASDVIAHRIPPAALANKIVLVGATAFGLGDKLSTPMGADFPGVEVHANAIDNILTGDFIQRSDMTVFLECMAALVMGFMISMAIAYLAAPWSGAALADMIFGYCILVQYLRVTDGLLVGVLLPVVTTLITYAGLTSYRLYLTEAREKRPITHAVSER